MNYVGIDWSYGQAAYCCLSEHGEIVTEGKISADRDGLSRLVSDLGSEVSASVEMMSGAYWVHDELSACGWNVEIANPRKVKAVAPIATKTDKVDARVLAQLQMRDLTPSVWIKPASDRELKEMIQFHRHLVGLRTSLKNRVFGGMTQWGLRLTLDKLRVLDHQKLLTDKGVGAVARRSVAEAIEMVDEIDARLTSYDKALLQKARKDPRVKRLKTIPGVGDFLGLVIAVEISDVSRFSKPQKLISYAGMAPRIKQSGQSESIGPLSKAGSRLLRWAVVEAAQGAWTKTNPWHPLYLRIKGRYRSANPAKVAVARKILIASWHVLSKDEDFKVCRSHSGKDVPASSTPCLAH